jgi:hypothetical protein
MIEPRQQQTTITTVDRQIEKKKEFLILENRRAGQQPVNS